MARVVLVGYDKMLYSLIEGIEQTDSEILGVFRTDRIKYSGLKLFLKDIFNPSKDYTIIKSKKLYDIKGTSVNGDKFYSEIQRLKPDVIIVGSWAEKFKSRILNTLPCINFHPALLPRNRGANPYFWSIYLNQKVTGLSIHYMNESFDKGDIILQEAITIDAKETGKTLKDKTTALVKVMVQELIELFDKKQIQPIKQQEEFATYEKQISLKEMIIDLNKPKEDVERHFRALYPWVDSFVRVGIRYIKISEYEFLEVDEKNINKKNYEIIEKGPNFVTLKGNGYLLRVFK